MATIKAKITRRFSHNGRVIQLKKGEKVSQDDFNCFNSSAKETYFIVENETTKVVKKKTKYKPEQK